jgi:hypothetical protein
MKNSVLPLALLVALGGCVGPRGASPARYVLKNPPAEEVFAGRKSPLQQGQSISAAIGQIQASCQEIRDIKTHNGRCVVTEYGHYLQIVFDERDYRRNVSLKLYPAGTPGFEACTPTWVVLDKKTALEHRWFYGDQCPLSADGMWQILKKLYDL